MDRVASWEKKRLEILADVQIRIILLTASILLPLLAACLGLFTPFNSLGRVAVSHTIYPALYGKRHAVPFPFDIGLLPSRGQAIFIAIFVLLNFIFSVIGYELASPGVSLTWDLHTKANYFANRVGFLSFANQSSCYNIVQ